MPVKAGNLHIVAVNALACEAIMELLQKFEVQMDITDREGNTTTLGVKQVVCRQVEEGGEQRENYVTYMCIIHSEKVERQVNVQKIAVFTKLGENARLKIVDLDVFPALEVDEGDHVIVRIFMSRVREVELTEV